MHTIYLVLLALGVLCFAAAAAGVSSRVNLIGAGLFCVFLVPLIQSAT